MWANTTTVPNAYFEALGVVVTSYHMLCCQECEVGFTPQSMLGHLCNKKIHPGNNINSAQWHQAVTACHIPATLPLPPTTLIAPLAGLKVQAAYMCPECSRTTLTLESLRVHLSQDHGKKMVQHPQSCYIQRLTTSPGPSCAYFKVQVSASYEAAAVTQTESALEEVAAAVTSIYDPSITNDVRTITPWLHLTGWYNALEKMNPEPLCNTVQVAGKEFPGLADAAKAWIGSVSILVNRVSKLDLQKLRTDDPLKE